MAQVALSRERKRSVLRLTVLPMRAFAGHVPMSALGGKADSPAHLSECLLIAKSGHWRTPFVRGWLRDRSALQLGHRLFEGLDRLVLAFLGQLVPVNFQRQALLVAADNSSLLHQVVVETFDRSGSTLRMTVVGRVQPRLLP